MRYWIVTYNARYIGGCSAVRSDSEYWAKHAVMLHLSNVDVALYNYIMAKDPHLTAMVATPIPDDGSVVVIADGDY